MKQVRDKIAGIANRGRPLWLFILPAGFMTALLAIPLLALLWRGMGPGFIKHLSSPTAIEALTLSVKTSFVSMLIIVLTGTPLAYLLARYAFRGKTVLELIIDLPIVLPPSVAGLALLVAFGRRGVLGGSLEVLGISLPFTTAAVIIAQTFVAAPLFIRAAKIGFSAVDREMEEAACVEGASQWQLFTTVMLPLGGRALFNGLVIAWARALGEFGATILFAGNLVGRTQTMPLAIYVGFESDMGVALALSVLLVGASSLFLITLRQLERTRDRINQASG